MEDFHNLGPSIEALNEDQGTIQGDLGEIGTSIEQDNDELEDIKKRVNVLLGQCGAESQVAFENTTLEDLNNSLVSKFSENQSLTEADKALRLSPVDYIVSSIAGGIAVVVDFVLVKIPKTMKFEGRFEQEGSPLTAILRKIGHDNEGNEAKWIEVLVKRFHVNYDPSIRKGVFGTRNHRIYSGGHDSSPAGLIFAVKDILSGTFTYFDKSGRLVIEKAEEMGLLKKCLAPIMWFGHLLSDLFTSAGVPVPGGTLLRAIQIGEFGKKGRTFGELIDWMYTHGYDMRHLATMSTCNAAIHLIIGLYLAFISPLNESESQLLSEREYITVKNNEKKLNMKFVASSIAVAGNVAKICAYEGNPSAFNYSIWYEMIQHSISEVTIMTKDKSAENAIEKRHVLDENFEILLNNSRV